MAYLDENGLEHFWGKIKDHVDSAVAPKADDADVVHKTGDVAIEGVATFQNTAEGHNAGDTVTDLVIRNPEVERGVPVEGGRSYTRVILADAEGDTEQTFAGRLGLLEVVSPKENDTSGEYLRLACYKYDYDPVDPGKFASFDIGFDLDGVRYATAPATSDDRTNSTDIVTRGYMEASEWNWQKSKKNALVQFKPAPESDLEPVVDFMFTETPPAEGEKGPENPSIITGVSFAKLTRCGKNLLPSEYVFSSMSQRGITVTNNADGSYHFSGTSSSSATPYMYFFASTAGVVPDAFRPGEYFTISIQCDSPEVLFRVYISDSATEVGDVYYTAVKGSPKTFTISDTTKTLFFSLITNKGITFDCDVRCQIEYGKNATEWETPADNAYTIQLGDTYYGGSLDVATGVMTVTWYGKVIDGTENWFGSSTHDTYYRYAIENIPEVDHMISRYCTHYPFAGNFDYNELHFIAQGTYLYFFTTQTTLEDWKSWLATQYANNTPVVVVYRLKTPQTVQLTPTQIRSLPALDKYEPRINTVYSDQEAVQVGYQRYANYVDLTTNQTIDGRKTFVEQLFINTGSNTYQTGIFSSQSNGVRLSSEAFSVSSSGAYLDLNGRSASSSAGHFGLSANSSAGSKLLQGKPDGTLTWNGQTIQTTSDERLKTSLSEVPDAVLDAWEEVNWGQFQYLDAVKEKGESARLHLGLIAQHVISVFEQHGLDACDYGILCHEEHEATEDLEAVDLWMVRYAEAQAMEACCMRRENARLKKRVADLEERLAALELRFGSE